MRRAVGSHAGWRNVAGAILADWGTWTVDDVPALRAALIMDHGGWVASPLGQIGSATAIHALVEDLSHGDDVTNQTGFALSKLGERALAELTLLLENDEKYRLAAEVIAEMEPLPIAHAATWTALALDRSEPLPKRIAALRGIAALGPVAEQSSIGLHVLLKSNEPEIKKQADITLTAVRDPIVIEPLAKACQPHAQKFDFLALESVQCLSEIAEFGPAGSVAGDALMPFLDSDNQAERAYGILILGYINYRPAVGKIGQALDSKDWRVVYAAIRAVGWLGDRNAAGKLENLASTYWLVELKDDAAHVASALRSKGQVERAPWKTMDRGMQTNPTSLITDGFHGTRDACPSNLWQWQREKFRIQPIRDVNAHALRLSNGNVRGELVGTDHGEWGGDLTWIPGEGVPVVLDRDNVRGMDYDGTGAIVVFGLAHMGFNYGYVLGVSPNGDGTWAQTEVAHLPGEPGSWTKLKSDRIAIMTAGRVLVFSSNDGILGVASCVSKEP
ncbi:MULTISPECIES: HEAT repeat domain-containing protein [Acidobacteriaceae]|uniref:HEAT repeat domain-containing protein n=1 Tax=Acidobacteriaceae TaxID=204434 RepID=UPI00131D6F15|nr:MULTISPECIES: HEAT repeat domain-containing protein [Acidobacteriaceae]MDW5266174.1 HEAT repeat domain-containing protein [Edaphobacter sp.]